LKEDEMLVDRRFGTVEEAAAMLGLSFNQTRKLDLPIVRVGRRVLVDLDALYLRYSQRGDGSVDAVVPVALGRNVIPMKA